MAPPLPRKILASAYRICSIFRPLWSLDNNLPPNLILFLIASSLCSCFDHLNCIPALCLDFALLFVLLQPSMADPKAQDAIASAAVEEPTPSPTPDRSNSTSSATNMVDGAKAATDKEQRMTLLEGIRMYPKAVAWSVLISTCIAMEGYDISLVNNFYAFSTFNRKYGELMADGTYQVPAQVCFFKEWLGVPVRSGQWLTGRFIFLYNYSGNQD